MVPEPVGGFVNVIVPPLEVKLLLLESFKITVMVAVDVPFAIIEVGEIEIVELDNEALPAVIVTLFELTAVKLPEANRST